MKYLVIGATGFIGGHVVKALRTDGFEVVAADRRKEERVDVEIDLLDVDSITSAINTTAPGVIINCAGILAKNDDSSVNVTFSTNILEAISQANAVVERVVIMGSASEYGNIDHNNDITEQDPILPTNKYGEYKAEEVRLSLERAQEMDTQVIVARVFNPIGPGMNPNQLLPKLVEQVASAKSGSSITVGRKDSLRDFIHVDDVAEAIVLLATTDSSKLTHNVYNLGSGKATSIGELVETLIRNTGRAESGITIEQSASEPEQAVAARADITRMLNCCDWSPKRSVEDAVKEVIYESNI